MSRNILKTERYEALDEMIEEQSRLQKKLGHTALWLPGRPGDERFAVPGMGVFTTKPARRNPGEVIEEATYPHSRLAYADVARDIAAIAAIATMNDARDIGAYSESRRNGELYVALMVADYAAASKLKGVLEVVSSEGWEVDPQAEEPTIRGYTPRDPVRFIHHSPKNVEILDRTTVTLADLELPVIEVADPPPGMAYHPGAIVRPVIR